MSKLEIVNITTFFVAVSFRKVLYQNKNPGNMLAAGIFKITNPLSSANFTLM